MIKGTQNDDLDLEMAMTEDEKHSLEASKASKTWRALRAATRTSFDFLDKVEPGKSLEELLKSDTIAHDPVTDGGDVAVEGKADDVTT